MLFFRSPALRDYWHPSRRFVETAYADLPFPFPAVGPPRAYTIRERWNLVKFVNYLLTWQGVRDARGDDGAARCTSTPPSGGSSRRGARYRPAS